MVTLHTNMEMMINAMLCDLNDSSTDNDGFITETAPAEPITLRIDNVILPCKLSAESVNDPIRNHYVVEWQSSDDEWHPLGVFNDHRTMVNQIQLFLDKRTTKITIKNGSNQTN